MKQILFLSILFLATSFHALFAFCGFYVAQADSKMFNQSSRVLLVRDGDKTTIGMMNDYKGELKNFSIVIPVPVILKKDDIQIGDSKLFDHLDSYSAPRLVDYFDPIPCVSKHRKRISTFSETASARGLTAREEVKEEKFTPADLGITIEESYTVGEYDIQILSAQFSDGLETFLRQENYNLPEGASDTLKPYIKQKFKFFIAKVNLQEMKKENTSFLRPLLFTFVSEKFMLPIRLGMLNANGPQDLFVFALTKKGRLETQNYRTKPLPTSIEIPEYIETQFKPFYTDLFHKKVTEDKMRVAYTEYFWNLNQTCDPCTADPINKDALKKLGVDWLRENKGNTLLGSDVYLTRLHIRYSKESFPEDLMFYETKDKEPFQVRYIIQHPWTGSVSECTESSTKDFYQYQENLIRRNKQWNENLVELTDWNYDKILSDSKQYKPDLEQREARMSNMRNNWSSGRVRSRSFVPAKKGFFNKLWQGLWK